MKSNEGVCTLCIQDELTNKCVVSDAKLSEHCPCKECLVRMICTSPNQACYKFSLLYDQAYRTIK